MDKKLDSILLISSTSSSATDTPIIIWRKVSSGHVQSLRPASKVDWDYMEKAILRRQEKRDMVVEDGSS